MQALAVPLLLFVAGEEPAKPKLPVGKDTTFVTGPLDKNGFIDYEAALNERLKKGVTPETNANVLLWKAFGPRPEGGDGLPAEVFKQLGIDEPPEGGDYFIDVTRYAKEVLQIDPDDLMIVWNRQSWAIKRPWAERDYADIAAWLKANERPLALVHEAVKRPHYFNPLCSRRPNGQQSSILACLMPNVQKCREIGAALCARAMLKLEAGKTDEAWADLIACHRLARHLARGGATFIETLVGYALHAIACNATVAFVERADLPAGKWLAKLKELRELPAMPLLADKIDLGERLAGLDALQMVRSGYDIEGNGKGPTPEEQKGLDAIEWAIPLRTLNATYDRMSVALRHKDRAERSKAFDALEADLERMLKKTGERDMRRLIAQAGAGKAVGTQIGAVMVGLLAPGVRKLQDAADRTEQIERNLRLALALAAYRADIGRYPGKLDALVPKYVAAVPDDVFSGKPLLYTRTDTGFHFYSVGPNGKDEQGRWFDDDPRGDDPGVRLPLPPLKKE